MTPANLHSTAREDAELAAHEIKTLMRESLKAGFSPSRATSSELFAFAATMRTAGHEKIAAFVEQCGSAKMASEFVELDLRSFLGTRGSA